MEFVIIGLAVVMVFIVFVVAAVLLSRYLFPRVDSAEKFGKTATDEVKEDWMKK